MSVLRPRVLFSRQATDDTEISLPDLQNPYERPNAIKTRSPLQSTELWWDCARFQTGTAQQVPWLILKSGAGDVVFDNGMIEWLVPAHVSGPTKPFFKHVEPACADQSIETTVSVCRQMEENLWVILGGYALVETFILPGETTMRYWLRPQSEQGQSLIDSSQYRKLKRMTPGQFAGVLASQSMECHYCGAKSDLAIGALNREDEPLIVCRQIVCFDRTAASPSLDE